MTDQTREGDASHNERLAEYNVVAGHWRQLLSIRFAVLTLAITFETALFASYWYVASNFAAIGLAGHIGVIVLPFFGVVSTYAIMIVEVRTKLVRHRCLVRGMAIELAFGNPEGVFHRLESAPAPLGFATQTRTIGVIYGLVYLAWIALTFVGISHFVGGA